MNELSQHDMSEPVPQEEEDAPVSGLDALLARVELGSVSRWLFWTLLAFIVIALVWASIARIDQTIQGTGEVVSASDLQVVTTLESGILQEVLVGPGQAVTKGSALLRLDPTENDASLGSSSVLATSLEMKIARLSAELASTAPRFGQPVNEEAARQLAIERALYASRQSNLRSAIEIAAAQIARSRESVTEAERQSDAAASRAGAARAESNMLRPLVEQGIEPRLSLVRAEAAASSAEAELASSRASIGRANAQLIEARSNRDRVLRDWRSQVAAELAAAQSELGSRQASIPALERRAERAILRSPVDGSVNRVLVNTRGSAVAAGEPLVEISPDDGRLMIEARIRPQDIASVKIGQEAKISITAFDQAIFGKLDGEVISVSRDSIIDERTGEAYFLARVVASKRADAIAESSALEISTGMQAQVFLLGKERTILQYVLSPLMRWSDRAMRE